MALYYDLPVFKDVYKLILLIFEYTKDFPKEYKYTLGQDLKRDGINFTSLPLKNQQNIIFGKQQTNKTHSGYIVNC